VSNRVNEIFLDNYPNPFTSQTLISFFIPYPANMTLEVCNASGQKITTLVKEKVAAGRYNVAFDATNMPNGIYIGKLAIRDKTYIKRMILMR
jgi:hypothetical protein